MRVPVIAGNWKMNKTTEESRALIHDLSLGIRAIQSVTKILFPPFISLLPAASILIGTDISLGAQNMHWEEKGAFTGEISPLMVAEFCKYVLIGHSERRTYFGETDEVANQKLKAAQKHGLIPILCIGETLIEKEKDLTASILKNQIMNGYKDLDSGDALNSIIAYEPVWAIGTGKASSAQEAGDTIKNIIRPTIKDSFGAETADSLRVLYGGSVNAGNAAEFLNVDDIDGALIGGASLNADQFISIVQAFSRE
ncbi:triose-phosphate isomerase [Chloroflexota bacterium]